MANISKCKSCGKDVPRQNDILMDFETNQPYRLCSDKCFNELMEKETAFDAEAAEWDSRCAKAIKKGEAESGRKFGDAGDALIMSWIDKYAYDDENSIADV
jgi:ribosomal protein L24E